MTSWKKQWILLLGKKFKSVNISLIITMLQLVLTSHVILFTDSETIFRKGIYHCCQNFSKVSMWICSYINSLTHMEFTSFYIYTDLFALFMEFTKTVLSKWLQMFSCSDYNCYFCVIFYLTCRWIPVSEFFFILNP